MTSRLRCGKIDWFRIPVTFGSVLRTPEVEIRPLKMFGSESEETTPPRSVGDFTFNALISSIQMFIALVSASFAITLSVYLALRFDGTIALLFLITFMVIGLAIMTIFKVKSDNLLTRGEKSDNEANGSSRDNLALMGIAIFYVTGCLLDMCNFIASVSCDSTWRLCNDSYIYVSYVSEIFFHVLRIVYLGAETLFCFTFNKSTFADKPSTRYGLMFLTAANLSIWFDALVHESSHMFNSRPLQTRFYHRCLDNVSDVTIETLECVYHNNTLYTVARTYIGSTFLPFTIEFTLLVGECLACLYFNCVGAVNSAASTHSDGTDSSLSDRDYWGNQHGERGGLQEVANGPMVELEEEEEEERGREEDVATLYENEYSGILQCSNNNRQYALTSGICILLTVSMNVVPLILALLFKLNVWTYGSFGKTIILSYIMILWLTMLLSMAIGYYVSGTLPYQFDLPYTGLDYLLLISSVGPLSFDIFTMISVAGWVRYSRDIPFRSDLSSPVHLIIVEISNILEVYFQTGFCMFARRIIVSGRDEGRPATVFRNVVLFLAFANGSLWLLDSFGVYENTQRIQIDYFGHNRWLTITNIFLPLSLFFRFNSCLLFSKIYLQMRSQHSDNTASIHY